MFFTTRRFRRKKLKARRELRTGLFLAAFAVAIVGSATVTTYQAYTRSSPSAADGAARRLVTTNVTNTTDLCAKKGHGEVTKYAQCGPFLTTFIPASPGVEQSHGAGLGILHLMVTLYIFLGIAIICDHFFEPSLDVISEKLGLSADVAGATFMAAGSSAPEFFTSMGDVFGPGNHVGIGTIVGSAMFNILVIVAASALYCGQVLDINWRPVARDVSFYSVSIALLVGFFSVCLVDCKDEKGLELPAGLDYVEGLIMTFVYVLYIVFMVYNARIFAMCPPKEVKPEPTSEEQAAADRITAELRKMNQVAPLASKDGVDAAAASQTSPSEGGDVEAGGGGGGGDDDDDDEDLWEVPDSIGGKIMWIIQLPFIVVLCLTIPDLSKDKFKAFYPLTFFMCIVWLGVLCWLMAALATAIGCVWAIDPVVMGILLLAVGTSVPDAIASMVVAKQGEGDMAIANAIGSNVFDILLGLGTPNFLARTIPWSGKDIAGEAPGCGNDVSREMLFDLGVLYLAVVAFLGTLIFNKWKMNKTVAFFLLVIYAVYVIFTLIAEKVHGVCVFKAGDAAKKCAELLLK